MEANCRPIICPSPETKSKLFLEVGFVPRHPLNVPHVKELDGLSSSLN